MTEVACSECGTVVTGFLFHTDQCGFVRRGVVDQELKPCGHRAQRRPWPDVHNLDAYLPREEVRDRPCPHDPDDRLAIIKHRGIREDNDDGDWLLAEILRLRGRLREVEWGCARYAEATELRCCPWCHYTDDVGHESACQLAAELRSTSP